eukprot:GHVQ01031686.1.p1 GENE.GHVQ01031686.1~~GHVQ01031686.1.p1  ORF type:complete len:2047 (-),score=190.49 GHVQ01031686.1:7552-13692(-)
MSCISSSPSCGLRTPGLTSGSDDARSTTSPISLSHSMSPGCERTRCRRMPYMPVLAEDRNDDSEPLQHSSQSTSHRSLPPCPLSSLSPLPYSSGTASQGSRVEEELAPLSTGIVELLKLFEYRMYYEHDNDISASAADTASSDCRHHVSYDEPEFLQCLLKQLQSPQHQERLVVIKHLRNIALKDKNSAKLLQSANGIEVIVNVLRTSDDALDYVPGLLASLCMDQSARTSLLRVGALNTLERMRKKASLQKSHLGIAAAHSFACLAVHPDTAAKLAETHHIDALLSLLKSACEQARRQTAMALCMLTKTEENQSMLVYRNGLKLIGPLLLRDKDQTTDNRAAIWLSATLANLARNRMNFRKFLEMDVLEVLHSLVNSECSKVKENAAWILLHMAIHHNQYHSTHGTTGNMVWIRDLLTLAHQKPVDANISNLINESFTYLIGPDTNAWTNPKAVESYLKEMRKHEDAVQESARHGLLCISQKDSRSLTEALTTLSVRESSTVDALWGLQTLLETSPYMDDQAIHGGLQCLILFSGESNPDAQLICAKTFLRMALHDSIHMRNRGVALLEALLLICDSGNSEVRRLALACLWLSTQAEGTSKNHLLHGSEVLASCHADVPASELHNFLRRKVKPYLDEMVSQHSTGRVAYAGLDLLCAIGRHSGAHLQGRVAFQLRETIVKIADGSLKLKRFCSESLAWCMNSLSLSSIEVVLCSLVESYAAAVNIEGSMWDGGTATAIAEGCAALITRMLSDDQLSNEAKQKCVSAAKYAVANQTVCDLLGRRLKILCDKTAVYLVEPLDLWIVLCNVFCRSISAGSLRYYTSTIDIIFEDYQEQLKQNLLVSEGWSAVAKLTRLCADSSAVCKAVISKRPRFILELFEYAVDEFCKDPESASASNLRDIASAVASVVRVGLPDCPTSELRRNAAKLAEHCREDSQQQKADRYARFENGPGTEAAVEVLASLASIEDGAEVNVKSFRRMAESMFKTSNLRPQVVGHFFNLAYNMVPFVPPEFHRRILEFILKEVYRLQKTSAVTTAAAHLLAQYAAHHCETLIESTDVVGLVTLLKLLITTGLSEGQVKATECFLNVFTCMHQCRLRNSDGGSRHENVRFLRAVLKETIPVLSRLAVVGPKPVQLPMMRVVSSIVLHSLRELSDSCLQEIYADYPELDDAQECCVSRSVDPPAVSPGVIELRENLLENFLVILDTSTSMAVQSQVAWAVQYLPEMTPHKHYATHYAIDSDQPPSNSPAASTDLPSADVFNDAEPLAVYLSESSRSASNLPSASDCLSLRSALARRIQQLLGRAYCADQVPSAEDFLTTVCINSCSAIERLVYLGCEIPTGLLGLLLNVCLSRYPSCGLLIAAARAEIAVMRGIIVWNSRCVQSGEGHEPCATRRCGNCSPGMCRVRHEAAALECRITESLRTLFWSAFCCKEGTTGREGPDEYTARFGLPYTTDSIYWRQLMYVTAIELLSCILTKPCDCKVDVCSPEVMQFALLLHAPHRSEDDGQGTMQRSAEELFLPCNSDIDFAKAAATHCRVLRLLLSHKRCRDLLVGRPLYFYRLLDFLAIFVDRFYYRCPVDINTGTLEPSRYGSAIHGSLPLPPSAPVSVYHFDLTYHHEVLLNIAWCIGLLAGAVPSSEDATSANTATEALPIQDYSLAETSCSRTTPHIREMSCLTTPPTHVVTALCHLGFVFFLRDICSGSSSSADLWQHPAGMPVSSSTMSSTAQHGCPPESVRLRALWSLSLFSPDLSETAGGYNGQPQSPYQFYCLPASSMCWTKAADMGMRISNDPCSLSPQRHGNVHNETSSTMNSPISPGPPSSSTPTVLTHTERKWHAGVAGPVAPYSDILQQLFLTLWIPLPSAGDTHRSDPISRSYRTPLYIELMQRNWEASSRFRIPTSNNVDAVSHPGGHVDKTEALSTSLPECGGSNVENIKLDCLNKDNKAETIPIKDASNTTMSRTLLTHTDESSITFDANDTTKHPGIKRSGLIQRVTLGRSSDRRLRLSTKVIDAGCKATETVQIRELAILSMLRLRTLCRFEISSAY